MNRKNNRLKERFSSISLTGKIVILIILIILFIGSIILNNTLSKKRQRDIQARQQEATQLAPLEEQTAKEQETETPAGSEEMQTTFDPAEEPDGPIQGGGVELTQEQQKELDEYLKELETKP